MAGDAIFGCIAPSRASRLVSLFRQEAGNVIKPLSTELAGYEQVSHLSFADGVALATHPPTTPMQNSNVILLSVCVFEICRPER
jgi:hypothetical protein